ncbi:MAG: hypothetical protein ACRC62_04425 [Microcoleus sp.]
MPLSQSSHFPAESTQRLDRTQVSVLYGLRGLLLQLAAEEKFSQFPNWHNNMTAIELVRSTG